MIEETWTIGTLLFVQVFELLGVSQSFKKIKKYTCKREYLWYNERIGSKKKAKEGLEVEFEGIGIGESNFKGLRIRKNYFIDKSMYIKDIIDNQSRVLLVTRPRRFGKTLNMSMLKYYFDFAYI